MRTWVLYWRMTRPGFLSITLVGCLLGFALAAACGVNTAGATMASTRRGSRVP